MLYLNYFSSLKNKYGQITKFKISSETELEKTRRHITNFMINDNCNSLHQSKRKSFIKGKGNKANNIKIHFLQIHIEFNASSQQSENIDELNHLKCPTKLLNSL